MVDRRPVPSETFGGSHMPLAGAMMNVATPKIVTHKNRMAQNLPTYSSDCFKSRDSSCWLFDFYNRSRGGVVMCCSLKYWLPGSYGRSRTKSITCQISSVVIPGVRSEAGHLCRENAIGKSVIQLIRLDGRHGKYLAANCAADLRAGAARRHARHKSSNRSAELPPREHRLSGSSRFSAWLRW